MLHTLAQCLAVFVDFQLERGCLIESIRFALAPDPTTIEITSLVRAHFNHELDFSDFSNSIARSQITWANALERAESHPLLVWETQRANARLYFREFGAWSDVEINGWSNVELNAMIIQDVAHRLDTADHRYNAFSSAENWQKFSDACESGQCSDIYRDFDASSVADDRFYMYIGI